MARQEAISKLVYLRLNPMLRMLCEAVKKLNSTRQTGERRNRLLRSTSDLLEQLSKTLIRLSSADSADQQHVSAAVLTMVDFVTLPLLAILRFAAVIEDGSCWKVAKNEPERIEQSAFRKCVEGASQCFRVTFHVIYSGKATLPNSKIIKYLRSIAEVLPSGAQVSARQGESARLDSGEPCLGSLHETVQSLVDLTTRDTSLGNEIAIDMEGGLMVRILDSTVALVEPCAARSSDSSELQLKALGTIARLLENVPDVDVWRGVFPGMYAGMYRRILHSIRVSNVQQASKHVVIRSVASLMQLLKTTLRCSAKQQRVGSYVVKDLQSLAVMANTDCPMRGRRPSFAAMASNNTPETKFLLEVNDRLPATLTVLVSMLTAAKSPKLREQAICLDRLLLIDTRSFWNEAASEDLARSALESCLVLCSDGDDAVATEAARVLKVYSKDNVLTRDVDVLVAPRVISLIERLPSLAQSSREMELQASLKLITGYLSMAQTAALSLKRLRSSLSNECVNASIRSALCTVLDVNFDTASDVHKSNVLILAIDGCQSSSTGPHLRYVQERLTNQVYCMIHALGKTLGSNKAALFVDACVANLYEACVTRVEKCGLSLDGHSQIQWLHESIGSVILAQEVLIGCFRCADGDAGASDKNKRKLVLLAQSILPILVSHPLWDLPTNPSISSACVSGASIISASVGPYSNQGAVAAAQRGNATISCLLIGFVGTIVELLNRDVERCIPIVLYPILEKCGQDCVTTVRDEANMVLRKVAVACGSSDVSVLVADNMESSLIGAMLGKIRVTGGRMPTSGDEIDGGLLAIVECAITVLRIAADAENQGRDMQQRAKSMLSYMQELTSSLLVRFDHAAKSITNEHDKTLTFVKLFDAAVLLLMASYKIQTWQSRPSTTESPSSTQHEPWFGLLDLYQNQVELLLSPRKGFTLHLERPQSPSEGPETDNVAVMTRDTAFVSQIAWRCGYLLSHSSLKVQIQSCNVLVRCFNFLRWVSMNISSQKSEANGPQSAILRQIHSTWPAIGARLKAISAVVTVSKGTSLITLPQQSSGSLRTNVGEQRVYLSKLLSLVAAMTECADDFMASRFREAVWPCICKTIRSFADMRRQENLLNQKSVQSVGSLVRSQGHYAESEEMLLLGAIRCLERVFGYQQAGKALSGLIPEAGSMLFPFLDHEIESIVSTCTRALQAMLRLDCDCLWRPLVEMSGRTIPACPIMISSTAETRIMSSSCSPKLTSASKQLISFIESLPEQPLG